MQEIARTRVAGKLEKKPSLTMQPIKALIMTIVYQITIKLIIIMSLSTNFSNSMINNRNICATPDAG
jgi:hypothetical protein